MASRRKCIKRMLELRRCPLAPFDQEIPQIDRPFVHANLHQYFMFPSSPKMKFVSTIAFLLFSSQQADSFSLGKQIAAPRRSSELNMADKKRVVVTGLGVVNGCGIGHEEFFQACLDGKSSIATVKRFDASAMPCQIASEISEEQFNPKDFFTNPKNVRSNDRYTHLGVAAARQALQDAGLGDTPETLEDPERIGVMVGTAFGGVETFEEQTLKLAKNPSKPKVCVQPPIFSLCMKPSK